MNTNQNRTISTVPRPPFVNRGWVRAAALLVTIAAIGVIGGIKWLSPGKNEVLGAVFSVKRGPLVIDVSQAGQIQNRDLVKVRSEVEGRNSIIYLVEEGKQIKKGDLLVRLDSSRMVDQKENQELAVLKADAAYVRARENFEVTKSQAASDVDKAKLDYKFAQMDMKKYLEGDYPEELEKAKVEITIAFEERERAKDQLKWSKTLAEEGYITDSELEADKLAMMRREMNLKLAEGKRRLLEKYTYGRNVEELKSNVEQAQSALERVKRSSKADVIQADADLRTREMEFKRQKERLTKLGEQIEKCTITAPVDGMVVYATTGRGGRRGQSEPLVEGTEVRERQELIHLPVSTKMMAEVKIHESSLRKVKVAQRVRVTVDAVKGKVYWGRVAKIGLLPNQQSWWMNPDLKVYDTDIYLDGAAEQLRAGMSCQAEIIVATYDDALYVPIQAVVRVNGQPTVYMAGANVPHQRAVKIGLDNNRMVRIVEGLAKDEQVLLSPPLEPSTAPTIEDRLTESTEDVAAQTKTGEDTDAQPVETEQPAFDPSTFRNMSREERQKILEKLSPEQRQELTQSMGRSRRGRRGRRPRTDNPQSEDQ